MLLLGGVKEKLKSLVVGFSNLRVIVDFENSCFSEFIKGFQR